MKAVVLAGSIRESFRPWVISRKPGLIGLISYGLRLLIDTPHRSLVTGVKPSLGNFKGKVLDIGAGSQFYRRFLPQSTQYIALELMPKDKVYGWEGSSTDLYDGTEMPYQDESFDNIICLEVLEHAEHPEILLKEITRVLKTSGMVLLSVPFAAKWHYVPYDYWRFTPSGLERLIARVERLKIERLYRRGGDFAVAFHIATVALVGLVFRRSIALKAMGVLLSPVAFLCGIAANICEIFDLGAPENTLGYVCLLRKQSRRDGHR